MRFIRTVMAVGAVILFIATARSQQVLNSGGGTQGNLQGPSHSFSIGEIVIKTMSSNDNHLTSGFLQPEVKSESKGFDYYPNPVAKDLFLVNAENVKSIRVYDLNGREVLRMNYSSGKAIPMEWLSGTTYLVNTYNAEGKTLHKFTILKQ